MGPPIDTRSRHPCVSQILARPPNSNVLLAWVKTTQPYTNTRASFVHKVCLWWGEPHNRYLK